jgi:hypothetical protein
MERELPASEVEAFRREYDFATRALDPRIPEELTAQITNDLSLSLSLDESELQEVMDRVRTGNRSPEAFGEALADGLSISQKFGLGGREFTVALANDEHLCFFSVQTSVVDLVWEYPRFDFLGQTWHVRVHLDGPITIRFGLNERGWRWVGSRARRVIEPVLRRMGVRLGSRAVTRAAAAAGVTLTIVVGAVVGAGLLAYITSRFIHEAHEAGEDLAFSGQYAEGYVGTVWARYGSVAEGTAAGHATDILQACGTPRPGITGDQIRLVGVAHAIADVESHGGSRAGAVALRRALLRQLSIEGIDPTAMPADPPRRVIGVLSSHLFGRLQSARTRAMAQGAAEAVIDLLGLPGSGGG